MQKDSKYEVGYRKPPKHSRFRKGQSGNPKGRRKKSNKSVTDLLVKELYSKIVITENGQKQHVTKLSAMIKRAVNDFVSGKPQLIMKLLQIRDDFQTSIDEPQPVKVVVETVDASKNRFIELGS